MLVNVNCLVPWLASGQATVTLTVATWLGAPVIATVHERLKMPSTISGLPTVLGGKIPSRNCSIFCLASSTAFVRLPAVPTLE